MGSINGSRRLHPLGVQKLHDPCPFLAACLPGPKIYVKEHLAPARYLPFQLGLRSVPLAQEEAVDFLPGCFGTPR